MRIAQIAPLSESVPPVLYGGTERVVSWLTEELVRLGHEVTLFASGDSVTSARLVPACPRALRLNNSNLKDPLALHMAMLEQVFQQAADFDLLHFHVDYLHFSLSRRSNVPNLTTLHGRLDIPDLVPVYQTFLELPVISVSDAQRKPLPWANWQGTVHHGMPIQSLTYGGGGQYLAFLGRVCPEKGVDEAIEIARRSGIPLKIAAKVDPVDVLYFENRIKPLLNNGLVEFIGEIRHDQKSAFLGKAAALLFPIQWPEPFGIVMIEALACGTPVIAYRHGSVPEIIVDGVTGFIVSDADAALDAVKKIGKIDRTTCRKHFEKHFSDTRMVRDYLAVYEKLIGAETRSASQTA